MVGSPELINDSRDRRFAQSLVTTDAGLEENRTSARTKLQSLSAQTKTIFIREGKLRFFRVNERSRRAVRRHGLAQCLALAAKVVDLRPHARKQQLRGSGRGARPLKHPDLLSADLPTHARDLVARETAR